MAAVAGALGDWSGGQSVLIDLEGHGREVIADGIYLSRTVGWFTTIVPVRLTLPADRDPTAMVRSVKEQFRRIPRRGIGYGLLRYLNPSDQALPLRSALPADVVFNYLGQLDQAIPTNGPGIALAQESPGPTRSPLNRRSHLVDVLGHIADRRLRFTWAYNGQVHLRQTIERVAAGSVEGLKAIIEAARSPGVRGYVPSDFPLANLGQAALDRTFAGEPGIEDVYPASPMQTGMLFDVAYVQGSRTYVQQWTCTLRGKFDAGAFADAWRLVVGRHPALRTSIRWVDVDVPMQVVHRQVELPLVEANWQDVSSEEQDQRLGEFLEADRDRGFVLSWAPLLRLALVRLSSDAAIVVLTFHHAILDGWCMPMLFDEVLTLYRAGQVGVEASLPARRPYRDFISWVLGRDFKTSESYWRDLLKGFRDPTPLAIDRPEPNPVDQVARGEKIVKLAEGPTSALNGLVRAGHLTLNTVVQGAWALLLARYSGQADVVFGATVSGRQANLDGVETMIGLFINTLPTRVAVFEEAMLIPWLEGIQERQAFSREHENTPLVEILGYSEIPRGRPLFESIVVFENYPSDIDLGSLPGDLRFDPARVYEETNFPLTLMVAPGTELIIRADYDAGRFDSQAIERLLDHLRTLLE